MPRTQAERKADTRARLLEAAAALFAEHGIDGVSIDAVADAAGRTSGAVYAHFGGKEGLATALVDAWKDEAAEAIAAEFLTAPTVPTRLEALWRTFTEPPSAGWVGLEHELWRHACRNPAARERLAERYAGARAALAGTLDRWADDEGRDPPDDREAVAALLVALLLGLEMQRRVDPTAVPDTVAVAGLRALLTADTTVHEGIRT